MRKVKSMYVVLPKNYKISFTDSALAMCMLWWYESTIFRRELTTW